MGLDISEYCKMRTLFGGTFVFRRRRNIRQATVPTWTRCVNFFDRPALPFTAPDNCLWSGGRCFADAFGRQLTTTTTTTTGNAAVAVELVNLLVVVVVADGGGGDELSAIVPQLLAPPSTTHSVQAQYVVWSHINLAVATAIHVFAIFNCRNYKFIRRFLQHKNEIHKLRSDTLYLCRLADIQGLITKLKTGTNDEMTTSLHMGCVWKGAQDSDCIVVLFLHWFHVACFKRKLKTLFFLAISREF